MVMEFFKDAQNFPYYFFSFHLKLDLIGFCNLRDERATRRERENLLLFALIPEGVEKTPFAHNELEMMTMARHQTFSRNFGPDHVLV